MGKSHHDHKQYHRNHSKNQGCAANQGTDQLGPLFTNESGDQHSNSHSQLSDHKGYQIQDLASGRYCGKSGS